MLCYYVSEININIYVIIINTSHSIKSRILYNVENKFFLEMHDCYPRVNIYLLFLILCSLNKFISLTCNLYHIFFFFFCFPSFRVLCPMLPVSLGCSFLIVPSLFWLTWNKYVSEININIYDIIINTSHSIKSRILYNVENKFFLEMHDCYPRVNIYLLFLILCSLICSQHYIKFLTLCCGTY
jgi:hypothetical protein